ncbi:MAG: hypothetical protein SFY69_06690 [Planctomycetota bacterium]|nr:hypothetical protein [Planctomycetota bacterium]
MARHVQTIVAATVLAMLVWLFAEAESLRTEEVTIELVFDADRGSERTIDLVDPSSTPGAPGTPRPSGTVLRVAMTVEGATESIEGVLRLSRSGPVRITPGSEGVGTARGEFSLPLRPVVRALPEFGAQGVSIRRIEPEDVTVRVDDLVTRDVKITVVTPEGDLEGLPEAVPATAKVIAPSREAAKLTETSAVVLRIDDRTWSRLVPGRRETVPAVPLEAPAELRGATRVQIVPGAADAILTVRSRTATVRLPNVPVHLRVAPAELAAFDITVPEADRALLDVTVSGPADLIRQIETREIPVVAFVPLSFEELERAITSKEAVFTGFPTALRFEAASRVVRLTITRRAPAGTGATPPGQ